MGYWTTKGSQSSISKTNWTRRLSTSAYAERKCTIEGCENRNNQNEIIALVVESISMYTDN